MCRRRARLPELASPPGSTIATPRAGRIASRDGQHQAMRPVGMGDVETHRRPGVVPSRRPDPDWPPWQPAARSTCGSGFDLGGFPLAPLKNLVGKAPDGPACAGNLRLPPGGKSCTPDSPQVKRVDLGLVGRVVSWSRIADLDLGSDDRQNDSPGRRIHDRCGLAAADQPRQPRAFPGSRGLPGCSAPEHKCPRREVPAQARAVWADRAVLQEPPLARCSSCQTGSPPFIGRSTAVVRTVTSGTSGQRMLYRSETGMAMDGAATPDSGPPRPRSTLRESQDSRSTLTASGAWTEFAAAVPAPPRSEFAPARRLATRRTAVAGTSSLARTQPEPCAADLPGAFAIAGLCLPLRRGSRPCDDVCDPALGAGQGDIGACSWGGVGRV